MTTRQRLAAFAAGSIMSGVIGAGLCWAIFNGDSSSAPEVITPVVSSDTKIIDMPQGYRDVAFTCNGATGVYVTGTPGSQSGSSIAVVVNDPRCP